MKESESDWKEKLAALFLVWPFVPFGFVMHFNSTETTTLDWIAGGAILLVCMIWAYFSVRYLKKIFS